MGDTISLQTWYALREFASSRVAEGFRGFVAITLNSDDTPVTVMATHPVRQELVRLIRESDGPRYGIQIVYVGDIYDALPDEITQIVSVMLQRGNRRKVA